MAVEIRPEQIFEAAADDESFTNLASLLADGLGARSGVIHWRKLDAQQEQEISFSGYFSESQMSDFALHFSGEDIWSTAVTAPTAANRAWNLNQLIPSAVYARSRIYNEWIRPIGDDTFHCLGAAIVDGPLVAEVGFHRGRQQAEFDDESVQTLNRHLVLLKQMIGVRQRLKATDLVGRRLNGTLDALGDAIFTVDADARLLHENEAARLMLTRGDTMRVRSGCLQAIFATDQKRLEGAIAAAATGRSATSAISIRSRDVILNQVSVVPVRAGEARHVVLIMKDPRRADVSLTSRLRKLYGLSQAEADIAQAISEGRSSAEIAMSRQTALATVRTQIKTITHKMGCTRQSEVVARVRDLPKVSA